MSDIVTPKPSPLRRVIAPADGGYGADMRAADLSGAGYLFSGQQRKRQCRHLSVPEGMASSANCLVKVNGVDNFVYETNVNFRHESPPAMRRDVMEFEKRRWPPSIWTERSP